MYTAYQNYWPQQRHPQQIMMAPYYYYAKNQNMYCPNYSQDNGVSSAGSMNPVSTANSTMNPMAGTMNWLNPMTAGAMNPMNTMGAMNATGQATPLVQQYYGVYPPAVFNNYQKYENVANTPKQSKQMFNANEVKVTQKEQLTTNEKKASTMPREDKKSNKSKAKQSWWKVNVNKSKEESIRSRPPSVATHRTTSTASSSAHARRRRPSVSVSSSASGKVRKKAHKKASSNKKKNADTANKQAKGDLIVLKKEASTIAEPQESQDIFHLINSTMTYPEPPGVKQTLGYYDYNDIQSTLSSTQTTKLGQQQIANLLCNNKLNEQKVATAGAAKDKVKNHCKEILSKFAMSETSNDFLEKKNNSNVDNYTDLGKNINNTMFFIMNEMHSINAYTVNYLSTKLTPRQKQSIALLIIDEVNALKVPQKFWGHVCRLVIHTLNDNFRLYFEKLKDNPESKDKEKNSWLWMVELANNAK